MDTLLAFFIGLIAGIGYYFLDYKKFKPWYRNWHKLTHKDPLPAESDMGFVYGQPFSGKLYTAIFLALVITTVIIVTGSDNILVQLLYGAFIIIGLMLAFYISPMLFRHAPSRFKKLKKAIDKMDEFEAGMNMGKEKQPETIDVSHEEVKEEKQKEQPLPEEENKEEKEEDKKDDDWRKGVRDFLDK